MNKIEKLIADLCPNGVEWKELGEVFSTRTGYTPSKNISEYWENGTIPWLTIEDIRKQGNKLKNAEILINETAVKKETFKKNSIILSTIATIGEHALVKVDFVVNQQFMVFTPNEECVNYLNMEFVNYYFYNVSRYCKNNIRKSSVPTVDSKQILKQKIPILPVEIQEEIVKILDTMTEHVAELKSELQMRTKQYEYYKDELLTFEDQDVEWKELGEVVGYNQPTKYIVKSTEYDDSYPVPVLTAGQTFILGYTDEQEGIYTSTKDTPVIIFDDFTTSFHWVDFEFKIKSSAMKILYSKSDNALFRYVYHFMGTIDRNIEEHSRQWIGKYSKIKIPIPPLEIQEEIVRKLDTMTNFVTELQKEIELRQKQFEYYREKLLTF